MTDGYHWKCFYALTARDIRHSIPLIVRENAEPPQFQMRNGVQCSRVHMDSAARIVAYVGPGVDDIRTIVEMIQNVEGT